METPASAGCGCGCGNPRLPRRCAVAGANPHQLTAMNADRFEAITRQFGQLRVAVVGDFCLDRYLEIDPARQETSIETGLPVYNVTNVRAQPGGAGTVLNNLVALGVGAIYPV